MLGVKKVAVGEKMDQINAGSLEEKMEEKLEETTGQDRKRPETGTKEEVDSIQESLVRDVCEFYGRPYEEGGREQPSMRAVAEKFGISAMKVKKILVTGGLFQTETTDEIQRLYANGLTVKQISELKNISVSNVNSFQYQAHVTPGASLPLHFTNGTADEQARRRTSRGSHHKMLRIYGTQSK